ncbi:hypothetical protein GGI04_004379 [Coemansia thaxteri]|nr:hypothetical protein GGI04_004379 [Coemansia thaxteri]
MEGLSGKELEDSIFGTSLHLDWAEETDSLDPLASRSYASAGQKSNEPAASSARPRQGSPPTSAVNDARHRGSRDNSAREPRAGRRQQQGDRQTRQDSRPPKPSIVDTGNRSGGGSGARGGSSSRVRSGRSASRVGGAGAMAQQQQQQPAYSQSPGGINIRNARGARDRSRSLERAGGLDQGRSWRGSSSAGRPRAEAVDRWEHDKFDAPFSAPSTRAPLSAEVVAADIGHIGKEGISHVTINRRGSNASSSRGHLGSSYEAPRRYPLDPDAVHAPDQPAGSAEPVRKAVNEPYRAPHRRRSSADNTAPPPHKPILPAATSPIPSPVPEEPAQVKPADEAAANDDGSSAEMEWENFVANGGLDMPIDRITDDLLKHPRSRSQSLVSQKETRVVLATSAPESQRPSPLSRDIGGGRTMAHDRAALLLSNDGDEDEDDASDHAGRSDSLYEKSECEGRGLAAREAAIRGSASTQQAVATASASAVSSLESNMASLVLEQVVTQRARRPSAPASERSMAQTAVTVAAHQQLPLDANPLGIQIKGLSAKPAISSAPTPAADNPT